MMARRSVVPAVLMGIGALLLAAVPAGAQWIAYNGHWYTMTTDRMTWLEAHAQATAAGGYLVAINDASEQTFIESTYLIGFADATAFWMGATDRDVEGTWVWTNGEAMSYTNWHGATGEPNDFGPGEDYGCMNWHRDEADSANVKGSWNDCDNNGTPRATIPTPFFGLIERNTEPPGPLAEIVPSLGPRGLLLLGLVLVATMALNLRRSRTPASG
jgi:hypothetical protein